MSKKKYRKKKDSSSLGTTNEESPFSDESFDKKKKKRRKSKKKEQKLKLRKVKKKDKKKKKKKEKKLVLKKKKKENKNKKKKRKKNENEKGSRKRQKKKKKKKKKFKRIKKRRMNSTSSSGYYTDTTYVTNKKKSYKKKRIKLRNKNSKKKNIYYKKKKEYKKDQKNKKKQKEKKQYKEYKKKKLQRKKDKKKIKKRKKEKNKKNKNKKPKMLSNRPQRHSISGAFYHLNTNKIQMKKKMKKKKKKKMKNEKKKKKKKQKKNKKKKHPTTNKKKINVNPKKKSEQDLQIQRNYYLQRMRIFKICFLISENNQEITQQILQNLGKLIKQILTNYKHIKNHSNKNKLKDKTKKVNVEIAIIINRHIDKKTDEPIPHIAFTQSYTKIMNFLKNLDFKSPLENKSNQKNAEEKYNLNDWVSFYQVNLLEWGNYGNLLMHIHGNKSYYYVNEKNTNFLLETIIETLFTKKIDYYFWRTSNIFDNHLKQLYKKITQKVKDDNIMKIIDYSDQKDFEKMTLKICKCFQFGQNPLRIKQKGTFSQGIRPRSLIRHHTNPREERSNKKLKYTSTHKHNNKQKHKNKIQSNIEQKKHTKNFHANQTQIRKLHNVQKDSWYDFSNAEVYIIDRKFTNYDSCVKKEGASHFKLYEKKDFSITKKAQIMGKSKNIYFLQDNFGRIFIGKVWKTTKHSNEMIKLCQQELVIQYIAKKTVNRFLSKSPLKSVDVLEQFFVIFPKWKRSNVFLCEPYYGVTKFIHFNNTLRDQLDFEKYTSVYGFMHFSLVNSGNKLLFDDLKGWIYKDKSYLFTSPIIHSESLENVNTKTKKTEYKDENSITILNPCVKFNSLDKHNAGIKYFKSCHKCSQVCSNLGYQKKNLLNYNTIYRNELFFLFCSNIYCSNIVDVKSERFIKKVINNKEPNFFCSTCQHN
ncbi:chascon isoform d-related [Anaeramoeba flamelloides]|uniref:Chascon isoform d-related n=1 Tax=Anaeramoeba flamelloides TaxID=1746091 RepID=A0AAV7YFJ4_9EUKA|nr:chascon isoform d-related [Anaeramoeba flamelloides]